MEIGEAGLAYYYHAEYEKERKELEKKTGLNRIKQGATVIIFSAVLLPFNLLLFFFILGIGVLLFFIGLITHTTFEREKEKESKSKIAPEHNIELHHQPIQAHKLLIRPHKIVRHSLNHVRGYFDSGRFSQITLIKKIIRENTGSSIDAIYHIYKLEGGSFSHEDFAKVIHYLREHGSVRVNKVLNFVEVGRIASVKKV